MSSYHVERNVYTYVAVLNTARNLLQQTKDQSGRLEESNSIASIVFIAFALEAYLNHLGSQLFTPWPHLERSLSPSAKLALITDRLGLTPDLGCQPYQSFTLVFKLRNTMAHGKTELVSWKVKGDASGKPPMHYPLTDWEREANPTSVERLLTDAETIIKELHSAAGLPEGDLHIGSDGEISRIPAT